MQAEDYAKARLAFLEQNYPKTLARLKKQGALQEHLQTLGSQAQEMDEIISQQMMTSPQLPQDQVQKIEALEAIPDQVEELVMADLILLPP